MDELALQGGFSGSGEVTRRRSPTTKTSPHSSASAMRPRPCTTSERAPAALAPCGTIRATPRRATAKGDGMAAAGTSGSERHGVGRSRLPEHTSHATPAGGGDRHRRRSDGRRATCVVPQQVSESGGCHEVAAASRGGGAVLGPASGSAGRPIRAASRLAGRDVCPGSDR